MFAEIDDRSLVGAFAIHELLAFVLPTAGAILTVLLVGPIAISAQVPKIVGNVLGPIGYLLFGIASGFCVQRTSWRSAKLGRFAFIPPLLFFSFCFAMESAHFSLEKAIRDFFWPSPEGDSAIVLIFTTFPTLGACCYSAGVWLAARRDISVPGEPPLTR